MSFFSRWKIFAMHHVDKCEGINDPDSIRTLSFVILILIESQLLDMSGKSA
jgi:hypothetical protein